ncbi:MAG: hypothetical protein SO415_02745 [Oliverpabstia sp.]|nr:hypothetical protein [Oliverpabstia sp.]
MKKSILAIMVVACLALGAVAVMIGFSEDKKAPEIQFQNNEIIFTQGDDYSGLLKGVTATDNRDGDVTQSLVVESVYPNDDGETATVVYVARDKENNIGKANKIIQYQSDGVVASSAEGEKQDDTTEPSPTEESVTPSPSPVPETTGQPSSPTNMEDEEDADQEEEDLPEGSPRIKLTTDSVTINKGESVNRISYVESITDDVDSREALYRQIQIGGDELDVNTRGIYELIYYVVDSSGNRSNEAKLTITVE